MHCLCLYSIVEANLQDDQIVASSIGPGEVPPPYQSSPHGGVPMVTCRVCQGMIDITNKREQHVVKCNQCHEATVSFVWIKDTWKFEYYHTSCFYLFYSQSAMHRPARNTFVVHAIVCSFVKIHRNGLHVRDRTASASLIWPRVQLHRMYPLCLACVVLRVVTAQTHFWWVNQIQHWIMHWNLTQLFRNAVQHIK